MSSPDAETDTPGRKNPSPTTPPGEGATETVLPPSPAAILRREGTVTVLHLWSVLGKKHLVGVDAEKQSLARLAQVYQTIASGDIHHLRVDMSEFDMCSSAVLGILVTLRKRVLAAGGTLSLTGVQPLVREKLEITKLHTLFPDMQEPAVEAREETAPK